ncbi:MAG: TolC family protein [Odoribacteraceae bacterium]|jgi:outer membrane protein TolC|nr:TolC family protein [Odoribacteraceae bacterium]
MKIIPLFFSLLVTTGDHDAGPYTLEACRAIALEHNRAIAIANLKTGKARHERNAFRTLFLPEFSAAATYLYTTARIRQEIPSLYLPTYITDPATGQLKPDVLLAPDGQPVTGPDGNPVFNRYAYFPGAGMEINPSGTYLAAISARQPIFAGGKILSAYNMARTAARVAAIDAELTRVEVITRTDEAFWTHVKALETERVARAFKELVDELERSVQRAGESGMKTRNDQLKVRVQANKADLQLLVAANAVRLSRENLCQVMGLPLSTALVLSHDLDGEGLVATPGEPARPRPEHALLDEQVKLKGQQVHLARSGFLPTIGVTASYGRARALELNDAPLLDRPFFSAVLSVQVPIFHWGEGMNKVRAARDEQRIAEQQRDELTERMELEARQAACKIEESRAGIRMNALALEQAAENLRVVRARHAAGMETLATYLEAQALWQQASLSLLDARVSLRLDLTLYMKATGNLPARDE